MERIKVESVSYSYQNKYQTVEAVKDVSCTFESGRLYVITGESGSGKSTFLSLLAGLDCPGSGSIIVDGEDISRTDRDAYRREKAAVIYQAFHLFPLLTAQENVMYPLEIRGIPRKEARKQAEGCLEEAGVSRKLFDQYPKMMSGGEQQRTAVARAMASGGKIVLADEPTGNLDGETQDEIMKIFRELTAQGKCVILVSHSREVAAMCDERYELTKISDRKSGKLGQESGRNI